MASSLPEGRYLTCPVDVPLDSGGQTRALLMRNRIFAREAGIRPSVLTFSASDDLADRRAQLLERGLLDEHVDLLNIYEHYRDSDWAESPNLRGTVEEPLPDLSQHLVSEQALPDGSPWRRTYRRPAGGLVYDYLRTDGTTSLRIPFFVFKAADTWPGSVMRVSRDGVVVGEYPSVKVWFRQWIRELSHGHPRSFVFMDSRHIAPLIAPMRAPNIHLVYLLHNVHVTGDRRWDSTTNEVYGRLLPLVRDMDAFVTLTDRQRHDIGQRQGLTTNMFVVPNPVDMPPEPAEPPARDPRLVTVVARIEGQKRLSHAIEAFRHVVEELPDARLEIWGSGTRADGMQSAIDRRGLHKSVTMMGHHPRARDALWTSSAMVMTSLFEGYPLSTLESLSHGCPVVSYDIKYGPQEQITDGVDGFLVPSGDTRALADRILTLLRDPDLVAAMSRAALEKARRHGYERFVADWAEVLRATVELKPLRTRLDRVRFDLARLEVRGAGLRRVLPGSNSPSAVSRSSRLRVRGTLQVTGRSRRSDLSTAQISLAAVHSSGAVVDVPLTIRRHDDSFDLRADVPVTELYPEHLERPDETRLRLRLVWANSAWTTFLRRPESGRPELELSYQPTGELTLTRP